MISKKIIIFILVFAIFNDIIILKAGSLLLTMPKLVLLPVLIIVTLYLIKKKSFFVNKVSIVTLTIVCLPLFSLSLNKSLSILSLSILQSLVIGVLYTIVLSSLMIAHTNTEKNLIYLAKVVVYSALTNVIFGVLQVITGKFYVSERIFKLGNDTSVFRASGLLSDPNYYAQILIFSFFVSLFLYKYLNKKKYLYFSLFIFTGVVLSGSRSGMLILFFTFALANFVTSKNKLKYFLIGLFLLMFLMVLYHLDLLPEQISYFLTIFDISKFGEDAERNSLQDRTILAFYAFKTGLEHFFTGVGVGNYPQYNPFGALSHNTLLEMFAEYGILGVVYFFYIFFIIPYLSLKKFSKFKLNKFAYLFYAMIGYSIMSFTLVSYYSKFTFLLFIILITTTHILTVYKKEYYNAKYKLY